jgi:hypothetical protein
MDWAPKIPSLKKLADTCKANVNRFTRGAQSSKNGAGPAHASNMWMTDRDGGAAVFARPKVGRVTSPGRYMLRFVITAEDLAIWTQFPDAEFALVEQPSSEPNGECAILATPRCL